MPGLKVEENKGLWHRETLRADGNVTSSLGYWWLHNCISLPNPMSLYTYEMANFIANHIPTKLSLKKLRTIVNDIRKNTESIFCFLFLWHRLMSPILYLLLRVWEKSECAGEMLCDVLSAMWQCACYCFPTERKHLRGFIIWEVS